jgi:predicted nucleic acid-binding protein
VTTITIGAPPELIEAACAKASLPPLEATQAFTASSVGITAYDAVYVALAETLDAPLLTRDRRLAAAAGHHARVELV